MKSIIPFVLLLLAAQSLAGQFYTGLSAFGGRLVLLSENPPEKTGPAPEVIAPVWTLDEQPAFPGGRLALATYLQEAVHYPDLARDYGLEGRVILRFTVHSDGRIGDIEVLREPGLGLGDAVANALADMPDWRPARIRGQAVCTRHILPVRLYLGY